MAVHKLGVQYLWNKLMYLGNNKAIPNDIDVIESWKNDNATTKTQHFKKVLKLYLLTVDNPEGS